MKQIRRGEIYYANLGKNVGGEQNGYRPVLILQNDTGNKYRPTTMVAALTSRKRSARLPTHVVVAGKGLKHSSIVMLEQVRTVDKSRLTDYIGVLDNSSMALIDKALFISLGLDR